MYENRGAEWGRDVLNSLLQDIPEEDYVYVSLDRELSAVEAEVAVRLANR